MKPLILGLIMAGFAWADTFPPSIQPERLALSLPDGRLGAECIALPGATCWIAWEDLFGWGDRDFNDSVLLLDFDQSLGVTFSEIHAGRAYTEYMTAGVPVFGQPLSLLLHVHETWTGLNRVYFSGAGGNNPDGLAHALVVERYKEISQVPEPGTGPQMFAVFMSGLIVMYRQRRRR